MVGAPAANETVHDNAHGPDIDLTKRKLHQTLELYVLEDSAMVATGPGLWAYGSGFAGLGLGFPGSVPPADSRGPVGSKVQVS